MTPDEYSQALDEMSDDEFNHFQRDGYGGMLGTRQAYVRYYVQHDFKDEAQLCRMLSLETEGEKVAHAAIHGSRADQDAARAAELSAKYAKESNEHAEGGNRIAATANRISRRSNCIAICAVVISLIALIVAVIACVINYLGYKKNSTQPDRAMLSASGTSNAPARPTLTDIDFVVRWDKNRRRLGGIKR